MLLAPDAEQEEEEAPAELGFDSPDARQNGAVVGQVPLPGGGNAEDSEPEEVVDNIEEHQLLQSYLERFTIDDSVCVGVHRVWSQTRRIVVVRVTILKPIPEGHIQRGYFRNSYLGINPNIMVLKLQMPDEEADDFLEKYEALTGTEPRWLDEANWEEPNQPDDPDLSGLAEFDNTATQQN